MNRPRALRRLGALARNVFASRRQEQELDDEVRAYLEARIEREIARGVPRAEVRRRVLADEGGVESIKELTRAARCGSAVAMVIRDLRFGVRMMRRAPGAFLVAAATLALGIGASIAMFTVMRAVLWRPLPYPDSDRLVIVEVDARGVRNAGATGGEVRDLQARSRTLQQVSIINAVAAHVAIGDEVDGLAAGNVSDGFLPALGVAPVAGRALDASRDGGMPATGVLISDALWRRRLNGSPHAIGQRILVNNTPREVVGVLPPGFVLHLPPSTGAREDTDVFFATTIDEDRVNRGLNVIARLAAGADVAQAQKELEALAGAMATEDPAAYPSGPPTFRVTLLQDAIGAPVRPGLRALAAAVAFVLLVSCVNVANLLLARGSARLRELAVRRALGASRARLTAQLLTESLLLSTVASVGGLVLARWAVGAIGWLQPTHLPRQTEIAMDGTVALFAVALAFIVSMLFGLLPAVRLAGRDVQPARAGRGEAGSRSARRAQRALVVAEIALSIVPLVGAGLMLRSFTNLMTTPLGFEPRSVLTAQLPISFRQFESTSARRRLHEEAFARVAALPGVEAVSAGSPAPLGPLQFTRRYGRADGSTPASLTTLQSVFPGYLRVLGTRIVQGRDFTNADLDASARAVIVDERIARALWPTGSAIGQHLALAGDQRTVAYEVVGVTEPVRARDVRDAETPTVYVPYTTWPIEMAIAVRSSRAPDALAPEVRRTLLSLGTGRAVTVQPLETFVAGSMAETRFIMLTLGAFAIAAIVLAGIGLYGTLAFLTAQRAREFGVRLAVGATRHQVVALVARESAVLAAIGLAAGAAGALAVSRAMAHLIYGVAPTDLPTVAGVLAVVGAVSLLAAVRPAWSAARTQPTLVLRAD